MPIDLPSQQAAVPPGLIDPSVVNVSSGPMAYRRRGGVYALSRYDLKGGDRLFVITELADNCGLTVTNAAEDLATDIMRRFAADLDPSRVVFVEHYDPLLSSYFGTPATRRLSFDRWDITWKDRRAMFVRWVPLFGQNVH